MKFLELTGFGNNHKHFISLRSISDIEFLSSHTHIGLSNGNSVNVIENQKQITDIITYHQGEIVSVEYLDDLETQINAYYEMEADRFVVGGDDKLPF
jgi:glycine cleavage system H lipoate-binding protein